MTTRGLLNRIRPASASERSYPHWLEWGLLQLLFPILPLMLSLGTLYLFSAYNSAQPLRSIVEVADEALLGLIGMAMLGNSMAGFSRRPWGGSGKMIFTGAIILLVVGAALSWWTSWLRWEELNEITKAKKAITEIDKLFAYPNDHTKAAFRVAIQAYWLSFVIPICFAMDYRKADS